MKVGEGGDLIVTHALGSCLGLTVYDPVIRVGGLLHAMLPLSRINPQKALMKPFMFVDTGVPKLFQALYDVGGQKKRIIVKAMGCGSPLGQEKMFKIGERNFTVLEKLLWKNNVMLEAKEIGGTESRTVFFDLSTGRTVIKGRGKEREL